MIDFNYHFDYDKKCKILEKMGSVHIAVSSNNSGKNRRKAKRNDYVSIELWLYQQNHSSSKPRVRFVAKRCYTCKMLREYTSKNL